ncbi:hypothetical protein HY495_03380 [Candidatus Woesearchaeota archaeon]|nr:hypothetical protein [Candidatus Woesearchaeota archaeon]
MVSLDLDRASPVWRGNHPHHPDYSLPRSVLLARKGDSFTNEKARFSAAEMFGPDFDALQIISEYHRLRGCYHIQEPFPELELGLLQKWYTFTRPYRGLRLDRFVNELSQYYLGRKPFFDEVLLPDQYEQIYQAFQSLVVPGLMQGRIDALAAGKVRSYTLEKILVGYEEFMVFTQDRTY